MTGQEWACAAHQRLCRVAELAGEYGVVAERTGNGDLAALVFQLLVIVQGDQDHDAAGPADDGRFPPLLDAEQQPATRNVPMSRCE